MSMEYGVLWPGPMMMVMMMMMIIMLVVLPMLFTENDNKYLTWLNQ